MAYLYVMKIGPKNTTLGCVPLALIVLSASCTWLHNHQSINIGPETLPQFESQANFTESFVFLNRKTNISVKFAKIFQLWKKSRKEEFLKWAKF